MTLQKAVFQSTRQEAPRSEPDPVPGSLMTPTMRAALNALEREFAELMSGKRGATFSNEVDHRIDVARRLLGISNQR